MEKNISITEYGAAEQVPGSKLILKSDGKSILVDVGLEYDNETNGFQEKKKTQFPFDPKSIETLLFTHAHADHMGEVLQLCKQGFAGKIYSTPATADLCRMQMNQEIMSPFSYNKMIKGKRYQHGPHKGEFVPFKKIEYTKEDLEAIMEKFESIDGEKGIPYEKTVTVDEGVNATFFEAGHIPGSAQILFEIEGAGKPVKVLTSFDLGRTDYKILNHPVADIPLVKFPHTDFPKDIDYIVVEATYGNRTHGDLKDSIATLEQAANDAAKNNGILVIPAFSIMRTHMLWSFLYDLEEQKRLPRGMKFYSSSPGADQVAKIILKHHMDLDETAIKEFADKNYNPFKFDELVHHAKRDYIEAVLQDESERPFGLIAASGMCDKGRIEAFLPYVVSDPRSIILLTGYAAPGTRADLLMRKEPKIPFHGSMLELKADVRKMGGLSGHADKNEIIAHLKHINPNFKRIFIKRGEKDACHALRDEIIKAEYSPNVVQVMKKGESYFLK